MNYVKELIDRELKEIQKQISDGNLTNLNEKVSVKKELEKCLFLIDLAEQYKIDKKSIHEIFILPDMSTGYSEYRIMNDCESDNKENWIELLNENPKRLLPGDLIIIKK